jgi:arabinose-5-phosphate isomerase
VTADAASDHAILARAREVLRAEAEGLRVAEASIDAGFASAARLLASATGRVVVSGVGKSGLVGRKLAATLASTGTPALFVHPVDAVHGDLGVLAQGDVVILCSNSGATEELVRMVPLLRRMGVAIVALTARGGSPLGREADAVVAYGEAPEAGSVALVPTTSTTAMLGVGDALAVVVMEARGFGAEHFAFLHPGGVIGRKIARTVADIMHHGPDLPRIAGDRSVKDGLMEILRGRLGVTTVVDAEGRLAGILTDGDLKRILLRLDPAEVLDHPIAEVMTASPRTIAPDAPVVVALERMENNPGGAITSLVVVDEEGRPRGVVHIHDCLRP